MRTRLADVEPSPDASQTLSILRLGAPDGRRLFTFVAACAVLNSRLTTPHAVVVTLVGLGA